MDLVSTVSTFITSLFHQTLPTNTNSSSTSVPSANSEFVTFINLSPRGTATVIGRQINLSKPVSKIPSIVTSSFYTSVTDRALVESEKPY